MSLDEVSFEESLTEGTSQDCGGGDLRGRGRRLRMGQQVESLY